MKWKESEEELLRDLDVKEDVINELHEYDIKAFNRERSIKSKQIPTRDVFFINIPYQDKKDIKTVNDLLDEIEDEALFNYLASTDKETLNIILLKILGYTIDDITRITGLSSSAVYTRIHRLKNNFKKM